MAVVVREIFSVGCIPRCGPPFPDDMPPWLPLPIPSPPLFRALGPRDHLAETSGDKLTTIGLPLFYVVVLVICSAIVIFFSTGQRNNWPIGLKQSVIDSIAVFTYKKDESLVEGTECCACLNKFQEDDSLRLLPKCRHAFHITCIDTWLRSHKNCPLCRAPIVSDNFDAQSCRFWFHGSSGLSSREDTRVGNSQSGPAVTSSQLGEGAARNESGVGDGEFVVSIPVEEEDEEAAAGNSKTSSSDSVLKRSVSLDSFSAPAIYTAEANGKRQVQSGSQSGPLDSNRSRNEMRQVFSWACPKIK